MDLCASNLAQKLKPLFVLAAATCSIKMSIGVPATLLPTQLPDSAAGGQQMMALVLGSLTAVWEAQMKFLALGVGPIKCWSLRPFGK